MTVIGTKACMITIAVGGDVIDGMSIGVIVHGAVDGKISMAFQVCDYTT